MAKSPASPAVSSGRAPIRWSYQGFPPRTAIELRGDRPSRLAIGAHAIWVIGSSGRGDVLLRIDPRTDRITGRIPLACCNDALAAGAGSVWLLDHGARCGGCVGRVHRLDERTGRRTATIPIRRVRDLPFTPYVDHIAFAGGSLWAVSSELGPPVQGFLWRIDPQTNRASPAFRLLRESQGVAYAAGKVWLAGTDGVVRSVRVQPERLWRSIRLGPWPVRAISSGPTGVWAIEGALLVQIDARTGRVRRRLRVPRFAAALALVRGAAFLLDGNGALRRVDGRSGRISPPMELNGAATTLGAGFGALWTLGRGRVIRVEEAGARLGVRRAPWCTAFQLRGRTGESQGAVGRVVGGFEVRNVSRRACTLSGAPRLRLVDRAGAQLPVLVHGGRLWLDHELEPAPTNWPYVTVGPGRAAGVMYEQSNACGDFGSVFFEVRLGHGGGTLVFPGELGGRCDSPEALPRMDVSVFFRS